MLSLVKEQPSVYEHDLGYKFLLSAKKVFVQMLRSFVDRKWVKEIDEAALERVDKSYILQDFHEKEADLVYKMKVKDQDVIFYCLLELQSSVDFLMPYRLLLYMTEIWRDVLKNTDSNKIRRKSFKFPAIIPIVLYNGKHKWTAPLQFQQIINHYELFGHEQPNFEYILLDINRYKKTDLLKVSNLISAVFLLDQDMKEIEELVDRLEVLIEVMAKLTEEEFGLLKSWIKQILVRRLPSSEQAKLEELIERTNQWEASEMVSNLEENLKKFERQAIFKGRQEGIKEGKKEGIREGKKEGEIQKAIDIAIKMLKKGMNVQEIHEITGLESSVVESLRT